MNRLNQNEAIEKILNFSREYYCSGSEWSAAQRELAARLPQEPFSGEQLEFIFAQAPTPEVIEGMVTILAKGNRTEALPYARKYFENSTGIQNKLHHAAAMAQLGDESGYQFLEEAFQRYMKQDEDMKNFDFEDFVYIFEEVLINERGQEMISRFRKEADYDVVWESLETPDV